MSASTVPAVEASSSAEKEQSATAPNAKYVLAILFFINLFNFYDRQIIAVLTEPIRLEWNLSDTQIGWMSTAFILLYALVGLPLGRLADTRNRPRVLAIGVTIWSAFTAASGMAWGYWSMFLARIGVGVGEASCSPASNSLIGDMFPPQRRARAIGIFMLGLPIGIMLSSIVSGFIARAYGWRTAFFVAAVPGLVLAFLIARVADPARARVRETHGVPRAGSWLEPYRELWGIPTLRWLVISGALHNFNAYAVNAFLPAYLMRYHGMTLAQASVAGGVMLGAVGIVSLLVGGMLADRARQRSAEARLSLGAFAFVVCTPLMWIALLLPKGAVFAFVLLMGTGWMFFYTYYVTVYPAIHDVVRPSLRGTAMAVYFFWMYVLGGAFGTTILGMASDRFAARAMRLEGATTMTETARAAGLHDAFLIVPVLALALAGVLYAASRTMRRDIVRVSHQ